MIIIEKDINELKEYGNNPRINDGAIEVVANSIKELGFKVPIIIDKNKMELQLFQRINLNRGFLIINHFHLLGRYS